MDDSSGCRGTPSSSRSGYDAFGIHSENYALKVGAHPMRADPAEHRELPAAAEARGPDGGLAPRAVDTTDPAYYKWTQWVFLQLYKQGLAYKKKAAVNWCPIDKTVLANEQVIGGACERCGTPVEQRFLEQWFFRITDYAGRLLANLDRLDWSETTQDRAAELDRPVRGRGDRLHACRT